MHNEGALRCVSAPGLAGAEQGAGSAALLELLALGEGIAQVKRLL